MSATIPSLGRVSCWSSTNSNNECRLRDPGHYRKQVCSMTKKDHALVILCILRGTNCQEYAAMQSASRLS